MKSLKKFFLTMAVAMVFSTSAFAASGFEFILNVPLGVGIGIPSKYFKDLGLKSRAGFDGGVTAQLGYMFQVVDGFGVSVLGELGYAHSSYAIGGKFKQSGVDYEMSINQNFHSFQIGLLPKFNIGAFSIGIGGGVKIPVAGESVTKTKVTSEGQTVWDNTTKEKI